MTQSLQGMRLLAHTNLDGFGDCMTVKVVGDIAYVGHMGTDGTGTSVVDISDLEHPRAIRHIDPPAGSRSHKVAVFGNTLMVNCERNPWGGADGGRAESWTPGLRLFDITNPADPQEVGFLDTPGQGVHRITPFHDRPYVVMSRTDEGFTDFFLSIIDVSDPAHPEETSRWWLPGMHTAGGETPTWPEHRHWKHHHSIVRGDRIYGGWWDAGLVILDVSDIEKPAFVSQLHFGDTESVRTHTALPLPGRQALVVTDEGDANCKTMPKRARMVDISDDIDPKVISLFPEPEGDFCSQPGWAGPHNTHEMQPGTFQSPHIVHMTHFNAGLRVYDVEDASNPREIAHFIPSVPEGSKAVQLNDIAVTADGKIFVTDRTGGGLYILEMT